MRYPATYGPVSSSESNASMNDDTTRARILAALGPFPARVALDPIVEPPTEEADHIRARVTYAIEPGDRVAAWLLTPRGTAPAGGWPGVLAVHQHANQYELGKSEPAGLAGDPQYAYGLELCWRGYLVLCPDLLCFEERRPNPTATTDGAANERFEFTKRVLAGSCLQAKYLHDLARAMDLLAALPTVNAARLGVIGHSLGGLEALWLTWYDPRIAAGVSSCGFGLLRTLLRDRINHGFAMYVPGLLGACDLDALVSAIAPRPFMLTAGERDPLFPIDGVRAIAEAAEQRYAEAGAPERIRALLFPGGHGFPADVRAEAYAFLDRWLA
jgi:dienelactone hydrolase